jgi:hypothetical protein
MPADATAADPEEPAMSRFSSGLGGGDRGVTLTDRRAGTDERCVRVVGTMMMIAPMPAELVATPIATAEASSSPSRSR